MPLTAKDKNAQAGSVLLEVDTRRQINLVFESDLRIPAVIITILITKC